MSEDHDKGMESRSEYDYQCITNTAKTFQSFFTDLERRFRLEKSTSGVFGSLFGGPNAIKADRIWSKNCAESLLDAQDRALRAPVDLRRRFLQKNLGFYSFFASTAKGLTLFFLGGGSTWAGGPQGGGFRGRKKNC